MNFGEFVARRHAEGALVVQPRMGLADPAAMRAGLLATKHADAVTVGTLTLDSYTRLGDRESAERALRDGIGLNGYPITVHPAEATRAMIDGVVGEDFPIQVRHGSARPYDIFRSLIDAGLHATEGGPVSYCLPYGRVPLDESVRNWSAACELIAGLRETGVEPHLESFGGCLMGQLCPPSLLVAVGVLEALFFRAHGVRSVSVSYAQQTNMAQDQEAIAALRRLCAELLPDVSWHVVVYAYMGLYPRTPDGARALLAGAVKLAVSTGSARLIIKTVAEAVRIPTVEESVDALEFAAATARTAPAGAAPPADGEVYQEAYAMVDAVLNDGPDLGRALATAFRRGLLDVPYCVHPDNAGRTRSYIDADGRLRWSELGALPLAGLAERGPGERRVGSAELMAALSYVRRSYDAAALEPAAGHRLGGPEPAPTGEPR